MIIYVRHLNGHGHVKECAHIINYFLCVFDKLFEQDYLDLFS